jgi:lipoic acid synthetase
MVSRDDLPDGGARHIVSTVEAIRAQSPDIDVELLISDLSGKRESLDIVLDAQPVVFNHNIETVPRLYSEVRPQADYQRSLNVLYHAAHSHPCVVTKSGIMLGLGETETEVLATMKDLRRAGCRLLTIGQYLAPSERHHPVLRYVHPDEFYTYEKEGLAMGFDGVASAPLVRSSYKAGDLYRSAAHR